MPLTTWARVEGHSFQRRATPLAKPLLGFITAGISWDSSCTQSIAGSFHLFVWQVFLSMLSSRVKGGITRDNGWSEPVIWVQSRTLSWPLLPSGGRKLRPQQGTQLLPRPVKIRFSRCFWDAERSPNLAIAQLGIIAQQHDRAVARGQRFNCLKEQLA